MSFKFGWTYKFSNCFTGAINVTLDFSLTFFLKVLISGIFFYHNWGLIKYHWLTSFFCHNWRFNFFCSYKWKLDITIVIWEPFFFFFFFLGPLNNCLIYWKWSSQFHYYPFRPCFFWCKIIFRKWFLYFTIFTGL